MRPCCLLLALSTALLAQPRATLDRELSSLLTKAERAGMEVGLHAIDARTGAVLVSHQKDHLLVPASNMKILTVVAALLALGPNHEILTDLVAHGTQDGKLFQGALRLRGEGDPTLRSATVLPALVAAVRHAGIERIVGDLLVDDRLFDQEFTGPEWPSGNATRTYMAECAALSLDHGTIEVVISSGAPRESSPSAVLRPAGSGVRIDNRLESATNGQGHLVVLDREAKGSVITVRGRIVRGTRDQGWAAAIHDPPLVFGHALRHALRSAGIVVDGDVRRPRVGEHESGGHLLWRSKTAVSDIIEVLLKQSQNHRADCLFKHLAVAKGAAGTFAEGGSVVTRVLTEAGAHLANTVIRDGSGLSRDNLLTAASVVSVLAAMWKSPHANVFRMACPAGGEGTLRSRLKKLGSRVRAKTGTLNGVSALSGYLESERGGVIAFSLLTAKKGASDMRRLQDRVVERLSELPHPK